MSHLPLPPGSTLGILGGGQLGRMLSQAAARLGFDVVILDPQPQCPAGRVSKSQITAAYDDTEALLALGQVSDIVTFEFENVPAQSVALLEQGGARVAPGARALAVAQDRVDEKTFLNSVGATTADFAQIDTAADLGPAIARLGLPALLKTRREGYDGKGQVWIREAAEAEAAFASIGQRPAVLEAAAHFKRELSVIAARGHDGSVAVYPLGENTHANSILKTTVAPATVDAGTQARADEIAAAVLKGLDYVGIIGIELFNMGDGRLLVNEIAPRVHNTGHWTQDGCVCDQFEQHIRAITGWPLGSTEAHSFVEMTNLLGEEINDWYGLAADPSAHVHLYGKHNVRPGRKMAHVNRVIGRV